jgi:hypothetical protein
MPTVDSGVVLGNGDGTLAPIAGTGRDLAQVEDRRIHSVRPRSDEDNRRGLLRLHMQRFTHL